MKNFFLGFLLAVIVLTGGYFAYTHLAGALGKRGAEQAKTRYHCPMHPTYISDKPGDCPICGMKLVPIEPAPATNDHAGRSSEVPAAPPATSGNAAPGVSGYSTVTIPRERIQRMGITVAEARRMELDQSFRTFGRVAYDETRITHIHTKFEGYIEALHANYVGQFVKKGDPLFSIYSPELYATENEYLLALRAREQTPQLKGVDGRPLLLSADLVAAARQRLALWDIGNKEIEEIERTRTPIKALTIYSPFSGYITAKTALQGVKVMPGDTLYDIVDLSVVWVLADVYETDLASVRLGQPASMTLAYRPGRVWRGRVAFIAPTVDPETRTVKARLEFANPGDELKPDMYADVVIGGSRGTGVAVPDSAVIATGERTIVFIARGNGVFEPREVTLGNRAKDFYEIRKGVDAGEIVVTGANFLLDSESKLKASLSGAAGEPMDGQ